MEGVPFCANCAVQIVLCLKVFSTFVTLKPRLACSAVPTETLPDSHPVLCTLATVCLTGSLQRFSRQLWQELLVARCQNPICQDMSGGLFGNTHVLEMSCSCCHSVTSSLLLVVLHPALGLTTSLVQGSAMELAAETQPAVSTDAFVFASRDTQRNMLGGCIGAVSTLADHYGEKGTAGMPPVLMIRSNILSGRQQGHK